MSGSSKNSKKTSKNKIEEDSVDLFILFDQLKSKKFIFHRTLQIIIVNLRANLKNSLTHKARYGWIV